MEHSSLGLLLSSEVVMNWEERARYLKIYLTNCGSQLFMWMFRIQALTPGRKVVLLAKIKWRGEAQ